MSQQFLSFPAPAVTDQSDGIPYVLGVEWDYSGPTPPTWTGVRWRVPDSLQAGMNHYILAYSTSAGNSTGVFLDSTVITPTPGGDQIFLFDTPLAIVSDQRYVAAVITRHYAFTSAAQGWTWPFSDGAGLTAYTGRYTENPPPDEERFPGIIWTSAYHISPVLGEGEEHAGTADIGLGLALAGEGRKTSIGSAAQSLVLDLAVTGRAIRMGNAATELTFTLEASGHKVASGTAALDLTLSLATTGRVPGRNVERPSTGTVGRPSLVGAVVRPNSGIVRRP